ncbi:MAG: cell division protein FtsZ, partial [Novosphingobium sp.]|nr:cell division protein FtsZ [Novosphingobium sp.]
EAAERAIANPLLDGVSMQGAKGVIISIIGGDDMKLLEVDEAANHIRELVDPDANIIWGSAFDPNLDGKIRVSVVATGIEAAADTPAAAARPFPLPGSGRGPALPAGMGRPAPSAPVAAPVAPPVQAAQPVPVYQQPAPLDLGQASEVPAAFASDQAPAPAPHQGGLPLGAEAEASPLLRKPARPIEPEASAPPPTEELLLDDESGGAPAALPRFARAAAPDKTPKPAGSTLFERMANLRGGPRDAEPEDDDPDGGTALNIPRFLGRQNNQ